MLFPFYNRTQQKFNVVLLFETKQAAVFLDALGYIWILYEIINERAVPTSVLFALVSVVSLVIVGMDANTRSYIH